jgi:hypothetical protein
MNDVVQKQILKLNAIQQLKKLRMLNTATARMVLTEPEAITQRLETATEISKMFGSPFETPDENVDGPIGVGYAENRQIVGLYPEDCHVLIAGQTGCGKSTLLKIIFSQPLLYSQLLKSKFRTWLFVKAQDMRSLLAVNRDILVVRFKDIKINPLEPIPGIKPIDWASIFADIWIQAFRLYDASKSLLIECLHELYNRFDDVNHYPTLFDLYDYLKSLKFSAFSRTARYQESVLNRLTGLIYSTLAPIFDCSKSHISHLTNMNVIFELLYLTAEQQVFIVNYLLSYLLNYKLINETDIRHFVGIDDANQVFDISFERRPDLGLPIIHHLLTTVRKSKTNIFACTQTPHQVGSSIHSNSFAKIMFSLSNGDDIEFMQRSMGIKDPEQKQYCYAIKPRDAVVKFSARYQEPFLLQIPEVNI